MGRQAKLKRYRSSRRLFCPGFLLVYVCENFRMRTRERAGRIGDAHEARGRLRKFDDPGWKDPPLWDWKRKPPGHA